MKLNEVRSKSRFYKLKHKNKIDDVIKTIRHFYDPDVDVHSKHPDVLVIWNMSKDVERYMKKIDAEYVGDN